ncbi:hypothetical protein LIHA111178_12415 [Litorimonas haliclonae]
MQGPSILFTLPSAPSLFTFKLPDRKTIKGCVLPP